MLLKKGSKKVIRENPCVKWLPMLYYKHRRLNGLGSPFGIETRLVAMIRNLSEMAKWPGEPVRD